MKTLTSKRLVFTLLGLGFVLLLCVALAASLGSSRVDILHVFRDWIHGSETSVDTTIVLGYRIPRIALAVIVGAGLATVGAVFQGILGNPLADPYILGVSGGASVGVALATVLGLGGTILGVSVLPATAFAGSVLTVALLYGVASVLPGGVRGRHAVYTLLLVGVVYDQGAGHLTPIPRGPDTPDTETTTTPPGELLDRGQLAETPCSQVQHRSSGPHDSA